MVRTPSAPGAPVCAAPVRRHSVPPRNTRTSGPASFFFTLRVRFVGKQLDPGRNGVSQLFAEILGNHQHDIVKTRFYGIGRAVGILGTVNDVNVAAFKKAHHVWRVFLADDRQLHDALRIVERAVDGQSDDECEHYRAEYRPQ